MTTIKNRGAFKSFIMIGVGLAFSMGVFATQDINNKDVNAVNPIQSFGVVNADKGVLANNLNDHNLNNQLEDQLEIYDSGKSDFDFNDEIEQEIALDSNVSKVMESNISELKKTILPENVGVYFKVVSQEWIDKNRVHAEADTNYARNTCNIEIHTTHDGDIGYVGSLENKELLKGVVGVENSNQKMLRSEFMLNHESSHCNLYGVGDLFRTGDKQVDSILNQYFRFSGQISMESPDRPNGEGSVYFTLHENYADVHGFVLLLQKYGPTDDVLRTIQKFQIERSDHAAQENPKGSIAHDTQHSLAELLKPENITKAINLKTPQEIQDFSLQIANKGTIKSIGYTHSKSVSLDSVLIGGNTTLGVVVYQDLIKPEKRFSKSNISINWENNSIYDVAVETFKDFKKKNDTSWVKSERDLNNFNTMYIDELNSLMSANISKKIESSFPADIDPFEVVYRYADAHAGHVPKNVRELKKDGMRRLESVTALSKVLINGGSSYANVNTFNTVASYQSLGLKVTPDNLSNNLSEQINAIRTKSLNPHANGDQLEHKHVKLGGR